MKKNVPSRAGLFFPAVSVGQIKYIALPQKSGQSSLQVKTMVVFLTDRLC